ncbi:MAG: MliC family protein [Thiomicrospira sp.]
MRWFMVLGLLGLVGCNSGSTGAQQNQAAPWQVLRYDYVCDSGAVLQVAYLNHTPTDFAVLSYKGQLHVLTVGMSASGVRYVATDEADGLRWHVKGEQGHLSYETAGQQAEDVILEGSCRQLR